MIKNLLASLRSVSDKTTAAEAARFVDMAREELAAARRGLAEAEEAYRGSRLAEDAKATLAARDEQLRREVLVDRAEAALQLADERHAEAIAREVAADRRQRYADAESAKARATQALAKYPKAAETIRGILAEVARADLLVAAANRDLPADADPIEHPEAAVRALAGAPEVILGRDRLPDEVVPDHQRQEADPHGRFWTKRQGRIAVRFLPARASWQPESLAATIRLPGLLPGAPAIWEPAGNTRIHGPLGQDGQAVLDAVAAREAAPVEDPQRHPVPDTRIVPAEPAGEEVA